ncbi:unnamed protein product [Lactuca virosa]|uniref:Protein kinase domain-containing protein n=1 Tax=Lactuca virosa TaxID=75947 RepID=A0AAU9N0W3_9ASTR|nr:unnamed protein product [Lactuca virosa]
MSDMDHLLAKKAADRYVKRQVLREGTYGVVYKAIDTKTGQTVAIKKIRLGKQKEGVNFIPLREINQEQIGSPSCVYLQQNKKELHGIPLSLPTTQQPQHHQSSRTAPPPSSFHYCDRKRKRRNNWIKLATTLSTHPWPPSLLQNTTKTDETPHYFHSSFSLRSNQAPPSKYLHLSRGLSAIKRAMTLLSFPVLLVGSIASNTPEIVVDLPCSFPSRDVLTDRPVRFLIPDQTTIKPTRVAGDRHPSLPS